MMKTSESGLVAEDTFAQITSKVLAASAQNAPETTTRSQPREIGETGDGRTVVECSCTKLTGHAAVDCFRCGGEGMHVK